MYHGEPLSARIRPYFFSAPSSVTTMRAPEAPIGWPSAQAPPWMLTFPAGNCMSCMAAMVTTAKASLISYRSTSVAVHPVFANNFRMAPTGAVGNSAGASAYVAWPTMRASGLNPSFSADAARISTRAAAPSEIDDELAGVTVPSLRNAGLKVGIFSRLTANGPSSLSSTTSPCLPATLTGATSQSRLPSLLARLARVVERMANSSCAARLKW